MRAAEHWNDFEVLDTSSGEKLERWGNVVLARPDPQIIWNTPKGDSWKKINARYHRSRSGGGSWEVRNMPAGSWTIGYRELTFKIKPMSFKHTGLFPEQAVNWDLHGGDDPCSPGPARIRVLNLFAYTGGATVACAAAGAIGLPCGRIQGHGGLGQGECSRCPAWRTAPIRWIVDDCVQVCAAGDPPGQPVRRHHHGSPLLWAGPGRRGLEAGGAGLHPWWSRQPGSC